MPERGGTTTQSGIYYQNAVAALYVGRLCDGRSRSEEEQVIKVRVEAPTAVDDIVTTFTDGHLEYIQAKESVRTGDVAWCKVWQDFAAQFLVADFNQGSDRLILHVGNTTNDHQALQDLCVKARHSPTYTEWWGRLTKPEQRLVEKIKPNVKPELLNDNDFKYFVSHVEVEIWSLRSVERDLVPVWMPQSTVSEKALYRVFHNLVGGKARIRGEFVADSLRVILKKEQILLSTPPDIASLHLALRQCGALLHEYKVTIGRTGHHVRRSTVDEIVNWVCTLTGDKRVAMLLDHAGMGKTVVMSDVLRTLEARNIPCLAIKADQQLSGLATLEDLAQRLHLPDTVEKVIAQLAAFEPVVVLIDQIDALSLSLAHDQNTLNTVLDLVARLSRLPGVAIVLSCRIFDRNSDPRLRRIETVAEYHLNEFSYTEVEQVLQKITIPLNEFPPALQKLLCVPLHLDLFVRALENDSLTTDASSLHSIISLQDLYDLLWRNVILKPLMGGPLIVEREGVVRLLTERMNLDQRTAAPHTIFMRSETHYLERAVAWLASDGIIISNGTEWSFLHQTFFDYCYAKQFTDRGVSLIDVVLQSNQGLFTRPLIVQVLAYLRGRDGNRYLRELQDLLDAGYAQSSRLRLHLRDLLMRWFGAIPDPTDEEWIIARRMLLHPTRRQNLLRAMQGNLGWFKRLNDKLLQEYLEAEGQLLDAVLTSYLISMIEVAQGDIIKLVEPYLERSNEWNNRVTWIVSSIRTQYTPEGIALFERLCHLFPGFHFNHLHNLGTVVEQYPQIVCRLIRLAFERKLAFFLEQRTTSQNPYPPTMTMSLEELNSGSIINLLQVVSERIPEDFLTSILPWLEELLRLSGTPSTKDIFYWHDDFSYYWHDRTFAVKFSLTRSIISALIHLSRKNIYSFHVFTEFLENFPYATPHLILANTYQELGGEYSEIILKYLIGDKRRLYLGDELYDSRKLISALYPHLSFLQRDVLESIILRYLPIWKNWGLGALKRYGLEQFFLLQSIPIEYLSIRGRKALQEWQRKFPELEVPHEPNISRGGFVGSPISPNSAKKMSNKAWLHAIQKYSGGVRHRDFLKGGAEQLSHVLADLVKEDPIRFYALLQHIPDSLESSYVTAFLSGFADSILPTEMLFSVIRRFATRPEDYIQQTIARALEQKIDLAIPDDLIALLEMYIKNSVIEPMGDESDPYNRYINSSRGVAFRTLMRILDKQATPIALEEKWKYIELAATDPSSMLRAGAIAELLYMLNDHRERAVLLFAKLMKGHQTLLRSHFTQDFIYYGMYKRFSLMLPFIQALMQDENEQCQQQGASLVCLAAMSPQVLETDEQRAIAESLADTTIMGKVAWRRGAAIVYSHNINRNFSPICIQKLLLLLNDEDSSVSGYITGAFRSLRADHIFTLRDFIEVYASSKSFYIGTHQFFDYLTEQALVDPEWTLSLIEIILQNTKQPEERRWFNGGVDLMHITLRVYNDPTSSFALQQRTMDVFDRLTEQYGMQAQMILDQWDSR